MPMQTETLTPATEPSEIPKLVAKLREAFESGHRGPSSGAASSFTA
jgi:hypothetical protein